VHELCAIWTPEVFLDDNNRFKNMAKALKRCKKLKCTFCGDLGAGLGCLNKDCKNTFHFLCAKTAACLLVGSRFIIFCPEHRLTDATEEEKKEEDDD
jgi:BRCA1-associated RING domain protein 1